MRDLTQPVDVATRRRRLKRSTITWAVLALVTGGLLVTWAVYGRAWRGDLAPFWFWSNFGLFVFYLLGAAWGINELRRTRQAAELERDVAELREPH